MTNNNNAESGIQKLFNKLKGYFVSKSNSSDVYGNSDNMMSDGTTYKSGLVPIWSPASPNSTYLKCDGTWDKPSTQVAVGTFTLNSSGIDSETINFGFIPTVIKVWATDSNNEASLLSGSLAGLLYYSGSGTGFTTSAFDKVEGYMSDSTTWTAKGYKGNYAYEAYR